MEKKLCLLVGLYSLLCINLLFAQIPLGPTTIQSPNAASLGVYGEIPVSLYTGIPQIEIPIYTLEQKGASVPISLSYHASSGIRPDMHPGWVGMGFSLSSGGVISRSVRDMPDDYSNGNYYFGANMGYYYNHNILNTSNWNQISYMQTIARGNEMLKDTEPDEFSFSFAGYNGHFYMSHDGTWGIRCDKPVKVDVYGSFLNIPFTAPYGTRMYNYGMSKTFPGFIITTEDGTKYYFGGNTNAIEYSIGFFNQDLDEWMANSWYLTKIVPLHGPEINFTYERDDYINQMYIGIVNDLRTRTKNSGGIFNPQPACSSWSYSQVYHNYNGKLIAPAYLSQITGSHITVKFHRSTTTELRYSQDVYSYKYSMWSMYGTGEFIPILADNGSSYYPQFLDKLQWKKLDLITIEKNGGAAFKMFDFEYTNSSSERLRLLSLTEQDGASNSKPAYTFAYDTSYPLPGYLSNKVDHWGFFNDTYADMSNQSTYHTTYYGYREPRDYSYLRTGILNKITYPTGGVTEFTYEPHRYSRQIQEVRGNGIDYGFYEQNKLAGGFRIRKISSYDPKSPMQKQEKEYFYVNYYSNSANLSSLTSSGVLGGQIRYYFDDYSRRAFNDNNVTYSKSLFSSQSVLSGSSNAMGSHVGYSEVTEKLSDGSYTRYKFSNFDNGRNDESADNLLQLSRTAYEPYSSREQDRGKIIEEHSYTATDVFTRSRWISYTALNKSASYVRALKANYSNVCPNTAVSVEEGTAYRHYTYSYLLSGETVEEYNSLGQSVSSVSKTYTYSTAYKLLTEETLMDSRGRTMKTTYKYPFDYYTSPYTSMVQANLLPVTERTTFIDNSQIGKSTTTYNSSFLPISVVNNTTASSTPNTMGLAEYDSQGNPVWVRKNTDDLGTYYVWSYGGQLLIAKIENMAYTDIVTALGGTSAINSFRSIQNPNEVQILSFLSPVYANAGALVTSYRYDPSKGVVQIRDPRGKSTTYDYDTFQRLQGIRDFNGDIIKGIEYYYRTP